MADSAGRLPPGTSLQELVLQARDLVKTGAAVSQIDGQLDIARHYGFTTWAQLEFHVEARAAIAAGDLSKAAGLILAAQADNRASVGLPRDAEDLTPMQVAALWEPALVTAMTSAGAELDLHSACAIGNVRAIEAMASPAALGLNVEFMTPMGTAIRCGRQNSVRALLDAGDDPNRPLNRLGFYVWELQALQINAADWAPIHCASAHGYLNSAPEMIALLVAAGADVRSTSCLGEVPMHFAACHSWQSSIDALISSGADIDERTSKASREISRMAAPDSDETAYGLSPLMIAVREGQTEAVAHLLRLGADTTIRNSSGMTAMHIAANPWWGENVDIVELLLDAGIEVAAVDHQGRRPMELAQRAGHAATVRLLS